MVDDREVKIAALHIACDAFHAAQARMHRALGDYQRILDAPHRHSADVLLDARADVRDARAEVYGWIGVVDFGSRELAGFVDVGAGV